METQYLQYFVSVAKHLNFNRAAEECHVSQPALSTQIRKFEDSLGCQLFFRSKRHVQLTPEGQRLVEKAKRVLCEMNSIRDLALELKNPLQGIVRVGFSSCVCVGRTFSAMRNMEKKFPGLKMELEEDDSADLVDRLLNGEFDIVLVQNQERLKSPAFQAKVFEKARLVHITAKDDSPAKYKETHFVSTRGACPLTKVMEEAAKATGYSMSSRFLANEIAVIKRIVEIGVGWSVVPHTTLSREDEKKFCITPVKGHAVEFVMAVNQGMRSQAILDAFYSELARKEKLVY